MKTTKNITRVRALYGRPANRTAMLDAIKRLEQPRHAGILFIPESILDGRAPDEFIEQIRTAMIDPMVLPPPQRVMPRIFIGGKEMTR